MSGSSAFSKTSLNIWKFTAHMLLKLGLENFEHYSASVWDECNCAVVWAFFGIAFLWDLNHMHTTHKFAHAQMRTHTHLGICTHRHTWLHMFMHHTHNHTYLYACTHTLAHSQHTCPHTRCVTSPSGPNFSHSWQWPSPQDLLCNYPSQWLCEVGRVAIILPFYRWGR